jgi:hypothetical protein
MLSILIARELRIMGNLEKSYPTWLMGFFQYYNMQIILLSFMEHDLGEAKQFKLVLYTLKRLSDLKIHFHKSEVFLYGKGQANKSKRIYGTFGGVNGDPFPLDT